MFATFAAVIVALFKDEIMKWFKRPNVDVSLVNENGFEENLDLNQKNPQAKAYICSLKLENIGNVEALQCQLFISEVRIRKNDKKLWNPLKSNKSQNVVKWGRDKAGSIDIPSSTSNKTELFRLAKNEISSLPTTTTTKAKDKTIFLLHGFESMHKFQNGGDLEIDYYLKYKNGNTIKFTISVYWDGKWENRMTEMQNNLTIKLNNKRK